MDVATQHRHGLMAMPQPFDDTFLTLRAFAASLLVFAVLPGVVLRLLICLYPKGHPRRTELLGELYSMPQWRRPWFVAQQFETALFEGLPTRISRSIERARRRTERRTEIVGLVGIGALMRPLGDKTSMPLVEVKFPIDTSDVCLIATEGFPLWESEDLMLRRNRRTTVAYADLSQRLAALLAHGDSVLDANWCTFATWTSRTIGSSFTSNSPACNDDSERTSLFYGVAQSARHIRPTGAPGGATFRALTAGNRVVFLEVGLSIAIFLKHFGGYSRRVVSPGDELWNAYWAAVEVQLEEFAVLDPSWLFTPTPPPDDLRLGLRQYFEALRTEDRELRSQHVLAGNLLIGAYEQRRNDGYVRAALTLFTERSMRQFVLGRGRPSGRANSWSNGLLARLLTRQLRLRLPGEVLQLGRPIPPPPNPRDIWHIFAEDTGVTLPVLQALITRYQMAGGRRPNRGARNWTSFDQRMHTIGNVFCLRQRQFDLFYDPFPPDETARILAGK